MASTYLISSLASCNSAENTSVRVVGQAISDAFANSGWTRVADTGDQESWGTVVANGTVGVVHGYEVWKMNDALANVAPCFFKWQLSSMQTTNGLGLSFWFGDGSNGAGTLTGAATPTTGTPPPPWMIRCPSAAAVNANGACHFRGNPGDLTVVLFTHAAGPLWFNIERLKDANGADTAKGVFLQYGGVIWNSTAVAYVDVVWFPTCGAAPYEDVIPVFLPTNNVATTGTQSMMFPIYPYAGVTLNPALNVIVSHHGLAAIGVPFDVTFYGTSHRYFRPANMDVWTNRAAQTAGNWPLCIRWE